VAHRSPPAVPIGHDERAPDVKALQKRSIFGLPSRAAALADNGAAVAPRLTAASAAGCRCCQRIVKSTHRRRFFAACG
jgi:hypothetical protein